MLRRRHFLAAAATLPATRTLAAEQVLHHVILDTDPGVDDTMALLFAHFSPSIELLGVVTSCGNATVDTTTRNALFLTEKFGIDVPVARGAAVSLAGVAPTPPTFVHGMNGLGDIPLPTHIAKKADPRPGWQFIVDNVRAHPHEISYVSIGHLTNLALALRHAPDIAPLIKEVIVMGGGFGLNGISGNVTPVAEANIKGDPLAADEVLGAKLNVVMAGLDVTMRTRMDDAYLGALRDSGGPACQMIWDVTRFYMNFHRSLGLTSMYVHDSSAIAYLLDPALFKTRSGPIRVVSGGIADGETIQQPDGMKFPKDAWDGRPSQKICVDVRSADFLSLFHKTLAGR